MGFLERIGLKVTKGDKFFISAITFMAIHLIWLALGLDEVVTMWPALVIAIIVGAVIMKFG
ncbi:MAG: DUF2160 domain-containing protein [Crenarchaeota archaeon]|nr:DUF2160 domain-containing protein [Thermoproteota archaeon]